MDSPRAQPDATRLLPLAERVLKRYPFVPTEVTHLATHTNVMFRVVSEGSQMVLRLGTPHANHRSNIEIEVSWLDAIDRETGLDVVKPIPTASGSLIVDEYDETIDEERSCVLFSWIPGQPMTDRAGPFAYRMLGEMCAALQAHGRGWSPAEESELRKWDEVFYYERAFDPVIIDDPVFGHLFDHRRSVIEKAIGVAQQVIDDSHKEAHPEIVHGDLHEWNVHLAGSNRLYAFDFEDVMLAVPAQDVSISLYSSRRSEITRDIRAAFRKGYETIAPWPVVDENQLDGFHAARQIMLMNYAARTLPTQEAAEYLDHVMPWLERYVKRYA